MSNKPWYYVKGRRDLTETLIANKREKEARREENWKNAQKYFNRCDFETKLHHQWNKARYLKSSKNPSACNKAPFDVDFDSLKDKGFLAEVENERKQVLEKLSAMVSNVDMLEAQAFQAKLLTRTITEKVVDLLKTRKSLMFQRDVWTIKENKILYMRFSADKLRHKGHLICQQLCFYKSIIVSLSEIAEDLLTKEEKAEMSEVVDGGLKIIQMYLAINYRRNTEFTNLYQEEAECQWLLQKDEWMREKEVWKDLVDKSLDVFFTLLKDKLEANISKEKELLQKREQSHDLLTAVVEDLKDNPYLKNLLTTSIKDLVIKNMKPKSRLS